MNNEERVGVRDGVEQGGKAHKGDERYSEMQIKREVEAIPNRGTDRLYREADGRNDGRGYSNISRRTSKSEKRTISGLLLISYIILQ